jgi:hypothetical protein
MDTSLDAISSSLTSLEGRSPEIGGSCKYKIQRENVVSTPALHPNI